MSTTRRTVPLACGSKLRPVANRAPRQLSAQWLMLSCRLDTRSATPSQSRPLAERQRMPVAIRGGPNARPRLRWRGPGAVRQDWISLRGAAIDLALRQDGELLVGRLFLVEVLLQQGGAVAAAELLGPGDQAAIAGDLVVLHRLRGGDERRIEHRLVVDLAGDVL